VRRLEREEANLGGALRMAKGSAVASIIAELEVAGGQLSAARDRLAAVSERKKPVRLTDKMVREAIADLTTMFDGAVFAERVSWVGSMFGSLVAFSDHVEGVWREGGLGPVSRSDDVSVWLRR
jgi:hypothetical protein